MAFFTQFIVCLAVISLASCASIRSSQGSLWPELVFSPRDMPDVLEVTYDRYATISLDCSAAGQVPPTIHWLKNGVRVYQNPAIDELTANQETMPHQAAVSYGKTTALYTESCVTESAVYHCTAENSLRRISRKIVVTVREESPLIISSECQKKVAKRLSWLGLLNEPSEVNESFLRDGDDEPLTRMVRSVVPRGYTGPINKPQIYMHTWSIRTCRGANLQLYCRVKDTSPSDIIWTIVPSRRQMSQKFTITMGNKLRGFEMLPNGDLKADNFVHPYPEGKAAFYAYCSAGRRVDGEFWGDQKKTMVNVRTCS